MNARILVAAGAAAIAVTMGSVTPAGAATSWQGVWRLNVAQSKYPPGFPEIHDHVTTVRTDDGKALVYTDRFTIGDAPPTEVSFDGAYDGKLYRTSDGQMMAFVHTRHGYLDHWTSPAGAKGQDRCDFSADGNRLTCHSAYIAPGAKQVTFVEVWDKTS